MSSASLIFQSVKLKEEMSVAHGEKSANFSADTISSPSVSIPDLMPVTREAREIWEEYRSTIEAKAEKCFAMPGTFLMIPIKMAVLQINGTKTYLFKARVPNNKYVNVRLRLSGSSECRDDQVAIEKFATADPNEPIKSMF